MREGQEENARPSRLHSNVAPPSVEENEKVAALWRVTEGGCSTRKVPGGPRSTLQLCSAGLASTLPASSRAATRRVWAPAPRPERTSGEEQLEKAAPSSEQRKPTPDSVAASWKRAVRPLGPPRLRISVSGGVRSTAQRQTAGVPSTFPARSRALTAKRCEASVRFANDCGDLQRRHGDSSSLQAKWTRRSFAAKRKRADLTRVADGGSCVRRVFGARVSTVHS